MPLSDGDAERLERVYRRAGVIRIGRRFRAAAVAAPVVLAVVVAVGALARIGDDDNHRLLVADGRSPSTSVTLPVDVGSPSTTIPAVTVKPPVSTPVKVPTTVRTPMTTPPTTPPRPPDAQNCGGYFPTSRPAPPEGMRITMEVSKPVVRRGEDVVFTMRLKWTGSEPYSYNRRDAANLVFAHLSGPIYYSTQYGGVESGPAGTGPDVLQPGEERTFVARWDTGQACGPAGMQEAWLKAGTYTVDGVWENGQPTWAAEPATFQITD